MSNSTPPSLNGVTPNHVQQEIEWRENYKRFRASFVNMRVQRRFIFLGMQVEEFVIRLDERPNLCIIMWVKAGCIATAFTRKGSLLLTNALCETPFRTGSRWSMMLAQRRLMEQFMICYGLSLPSVFRNTNVNSA